MSDRAALYAVTVRPRTRGSAPLPLGDLGDMLAGILDGFSETSGPRVVRVLEVARDGDDLFAVVQHGARGVAADIVDASGAVRLRQMPEDVQLVRTGCLFRLPPGETAGRLAVHVSNGRGVKELFGEGLATRFHSLRPGMVLAIERVGQPEALQAAVAAGRVEKLRLVGGPAIADAGRWVAGETARVELAVSARGSGLRPTLIERHLRGDRSALPEILRFAGLTFEHASVGVRLDDGSRRLFDLARPEAGPPAARVLDGIVLDDAGEPTGASLLVALRAVVSS
jgi:hypothetical protein